MFLTPRVDIAEDVDDESGTCSSPVVNCVEAT